MQAPPDDIKETVRECAVQPMEMSHAKPGWSKSSMKATRRRLAGGPLTGELFRGPAMRIGSETDGRAGKRLEY